MNWLHLGEPVEPLLERFVEPDVRLRLHESILLLELQDSRPIAVALFRNRAVAIRYRYPGRPHEPAVATSMADAERFLLPETAANHQYNLLPRPDGWLLTTPDCPPDWLRAVDPDLNDQR